MPTCIYSGKCFTQADGEHILQNSLGARWTSHEIVCNEVQKQFGETIDVAVADAIHALRTIHGTASGRGGPVPPLRNIETVGGNIVDVGAGLKPRLREPKVEMITGADGREKVQFTMGDPRQIEWALAKTREMFPGSTLTKEMLLKHGEPGNATPERLKIPIRLGEPAFFRGLLKSCFNLFGVNYRHEALDKCFDPLRDFVLNGVGDSNNFAEFLVSEKPPELPPLGFADHGIYLVQRGSSIQGIIRLFGGLVFPVQLTDRFAGKMQEPCSYIVNPRRNSYPDQEKRNSPFPEDSIPQFAALRQKPEQPVGEIIGAMVSRVLDQHVIYEKVSVIIAQARSEVFGPTGETPPTDEHLERLKVVVNERLAAAGLLQDSKVQQPEA